MHPSRLRYNWRLVRWRLQHRLAPHDVTLRTRNGELTFSSKDDAVGRSLYARGEWSRDLIDGSLAWLVEHQLLGDGPTRLINVGANIGATLIPLMQSGLFQNAVAFEPDPGNFRYLAANAERNGIARDVELHPAAVSDHTGTAKLELSGTNFGDHRVRATGGGPELYAESDRQTIDVPVKTLDGFLQSEPQPIESAHLIWVDIQGHEGRFFEGARRTLGLCSAVVSEVWPYGIRRSGMTLQQYHGLLQELFSQFVVARGGHWRRRPIREIDGLLARFARTRFSTDVIFLTPGRQGSAQRLAG